jgi:SAM-dependent MidA family methyltransferase
MMKATSETESASLAGRLRERIRREGRISFREWMQAALYDERDGYYCRGDRLRWGRRGDYRTASESSPLFAATFARYFMKLFCELGSPKRWTIAEAGAGAGDFARGVLSNLQSRFPEVLVATRYLIDEVSIDAQARIRANLGPFADRVEFRRLSEITEAFGHAVIFSNELLDAFPVHRVIGRGGNLRELCVGLNESNSFVWIESDLSERVAQHCRRIQLRLAEGQIAEVNLAAEDFVSRAASLIDQGFLITVDYGAERNNLLTAPNRFAGTLRAFAEHRMATDIFANPGEQDITTTIDWTQIQEAGSGSGFENLRLEPLDQFLVSEGLLEELATATANTGNSVEALRLRTGARDLIRPDGMAASFQVLVQRKN